MSHEELQELARLLLSSVFKGNTYPEHVVNAAVTVLNLRAH